MIAESFIASTGIAQNEASASGGVVSFYESRWSEIAGSASVLPTHGTIEYILRTAAISGSSSLIGEAATLAARSAAIQAWSTVYTHQAFRYVRTAAIVGQAVTSFSSAAIAPRAATISAPSTVSPLSGYLAPRSSTVDGSAAVAPASANSTARLASIVGQGVVTPLSSSTLVPVVFPPPEADVVFVVRHEQRVYAVQG